MGSGIGTRPRIKMTGRMIAAARALSGIGVEPFAEAAGLPAKRLAELERKGSAWLRSESEAKAVSRAFDRFGVRLDRRGRRHGRRCQIEVHPPGCKADRAPGG